MVDNTKFSNIRVKKIRSPKVNRNPLFKKEFTKTVKNLDNKKIKLKSKKKKKNTILDIPTDLSIKHIEPSKLPHIEPSKLPHIEPSKLPSKWPSKLPSKLPSKSPIKYKKDKKLTKKLTKKFKSNNKERTISVEFKKNNKEKEINRLLNSFNKMDLKDIQSKLKSKGINTKKNDKNKLLKYIYLLTCVDDNINIIKG